MENNFERNIIEKSQLLQATFIFQWIFSTMGMNLPPYLNCSKDNWQKKYLRCLWLIFATHSIFLILLVVWIVYINNVIVDVVVYNYDLDSITRVLSISVNITVAFVQVIMQSVAFIKQKCLKMMVNRIAQLEQDILQYLREYQWLKNDDINLNFSQRLERFRCYLLCCFGLYSILFSSLLCFVNYHLVADIMEFRDKGLTLLCTTALQMKLVEYCIIIQILNEFIAALQNFLRCLKYEIARSERKPPISLLYHRKLIANQFLLNRIWLLVTNIEEYFAIPMLVLYLYNGMAITHTINWSYVWSFANVERNFYGICKYFLWER